jgi:drug/metabolite transporter (DMT)-like permease
MYRGQLKWQPIVTLLLLAMIWGANMAMIKIGVRELAPLFMAGTRALIAGGCLYIWMRIKGIEAFPSRAILFHGIMVGLLFGGEFGLIYAALKQNMASRVYILVYTTPFFVALQAHFFLPGDRITPYKLLGLLFAFGGIVALFVKDFQTVSFSILPGDLMALTAAFLWATTTVYLKKFLVHQTRPVQSQFYQVFFSAPFLLILSFLFEDPIITGFSLMTGFSLFYQSIIITFLSFLVWFELVHKYPVSLLHAFSFFTPLFGVVISGMLILGETITLNVVVALVLISLGMVLVNYHPASSDTQKN